MQESVTESVAEPRTQALESEVVTLNPGGTTV